MNVAVVAASSVVPQLDLQIGVERLRAMGVVVNVQGNCASEHFFFAGTDRERADAFYAASTSEDADVLWCGGGGSGAQRILPMLAELPVPPRKTLLGFSDATSLMSFARSHWNWRTIHAPMVAGLAECNHADLTAAIALAENRQPAPPWGGWPLRWIRPPADAIEGEMIGGNLAVWTSLLGTPFLESSAGKIVFFEDVGEQPYRIDRLVTQLHQSGQFSDVAAIVLGAFTDCDDRVRQVRLRSDPNVRVPLRHEWPIDEALVETFGRLGVPVAMGLPVGHGRFTTPLSLGATAKLGVDGLLECITGILPVLF